MLLATYTLVHVVISLVGIFAGLVIVSGLLTSRRLDGWTKLFLWTTVTTSVTGFFFPFHGMTPAIVTGIISMVVLAPAIYARYVRQLAGGWRKTYVITAMIVLYLNVFVLIVQSFLKIPALHALAPTQGEPPFKLTQLVALAVFVVLTIIAAAKFRGEPIRAGQT